MRIKNMGDLSLDDLQQEVDKGGKLVYYAFTISLIVVSFKRVSGVYLVRAGESGTARVLFFTIVSMLFGWWGIPWGPKHTLESIKTNLHGGMDVTDEVMARVTGYVLFEETERTRVHQQ